MQKINAVSRHGETCLLVQDSAVLFRSTSCWPLSQAQRRIFIFGTGKQRERFSLQQPWATVWWATSYVVVAGLRGRDFLTLEHLIWQNACSAEWVINIFHTFSQKIKGLFTQKMFLCTTALLFICFLRCFHCVQHSILKLLKLFHYLAFSAFKYKSVFLVNDMNSI